MGSELRDRLRDRLGRTSEGRGARRDRWSCCRRRSRSIVASEHNRGSIVMNIIRILIPICLALAMPAVAQAQVAGSTLIGVSVGEMRDVALGWSAKRQILGQPVYNDNNERVG